MRNLTQLAAVIAFAILLPGCGGGSGGGGSASGASPAAATVSNPEGSWLTFDPVTPVVTQYQGESASVTINATSTRTFATPVNMAIIDSAGVITDQVSVSSASPASYVASLHTAASLSIGTHATTLEVRMCEDAPATCAKPLPGSPWRLPLTVSVRSTTNLSPLKVIDGLGSWTTYQGNAAHTGFVDASFDPSAFSRRWRIPAFDASPNGYASVAIDGGRVYFTNLSMADEGKVVAVSEDTGEVAWTVYLGFGLASLGSPAAANGRVYYMTDTYDGRMGSSGLTVRDQATGTLLKQGPGTTQLAWRSYSAPTVFGTDVYAFAGLASVAKYVNQADDVGWFGGAPAGEGWAPATDGRFMYTVGNSRVTFTALNSSDGSRAFSIAQPVSSNTSPAAARVVLSDTSQAFVVTGTRLQAFDLVAQKSLWIKDGHGNVAYGNGTVYAISDDGRALQALSPTTGDLLWSWSDSEANVFWEVIVTRNLAFVSSHSLTKAIDLNTHKVVWTYPQGGTLAISPRGVLYIFDSYGSLAAVNLR